MVSAQRVGDGEAELVSAVHRQALLLRPDHARHALDVLALLLELLDVMSFRWKSYIFHDFSTKNSSKINGADVGWEDGAVTNGKQAAVMDVAGIADFTPAYFDGCLAVGTKVNAPPANALRVTIWKTQVAQL